MIHFITPLYRVNNLKIIYSTIINQVENFKWHLIEGSNRIGEESFDNILSDSRVIHYKIKTDFTYGHEQRNYFITNIKCDDNDWCYFLDDDNIITQDLIDVLTVEYNTDCDVVLLSQKQGLTEKIRLYGYNGHLKLGMVDIGSFSMKYRIIKNTIINHESLRNADGHYAEQISLRPNLKIKYYPEKFTRYNSLSLEIN